MKRLVIVGAVVAMLAAGCGGDGGSNLNEDEQVLADAIAEAMLAEDTGDMPFGEEEASCFGDRIVEEMGVDGLVAVGLDAAALEAGTSPADVDLSDDDIDKMSQVMVECVDFRGVLVESMTGSGVSEEGARCIADGISDDLIAEMAASGLADPSGETVMTDALTEQMFSLMAECLTAEDLSNMGGG